MASTKVSDLVDLAGGQVPTDLVNIVDVSAGASGSKRSTLNDLLSVITKNITDLTVAFQDGAAGSVSAASQGKIRYNNSVPGFQVSLNGAAYDTIATLAARLTLTPVANSSGVAPYLRIVTPADTAQTANTEFPGIFLGGNASGASVTRQGADGTTYALQREIIAPSPTYAFVGATTVTDAVTLEVGAPIAGTNATLTRRAHYGWNGADGTAIAFHGRNVDLGSNQVITTHDSGGQVRLELMRDRLRFFESEGQIVNTFGSGSISIGSGNVTQRVMIDSAGLVGINKASSIGAQIHTVSGSTSRVGEIVDSAASNTADIAQFRQNASSTAQFAIKPDGMFTWPGVKVLAADFAKSDTTYATITGFSVDVRAGRTYTVKCYVTMSLNTTGGGKFRFSGTATMTDFGALYQIYNPATNAVISIGGATFAGDINEGITSGIGAAHMTIFGSFVVNAAGTITFQFAQNSASGTSTVNKNATFMEIIEQQ